MKALRANTTTEKSQKHEQMKALHQEAAAKLKSILTPAQFQKFEAMHEARIEQKGSHQKEGKSPTAT